MNAGLSCVCSNSTTFFARHPEVEQVILYGSRVKGNYRSGSLIAPALQGGDGLTERVLYSIVRELDELLVPYSFDVSIHSMIVNEALLPFNHTAI
ncbi:MAG: nucleotidyltransferase domain-containing protein [Verrucomicrobiae bacterium]|nr:nucleotidyltransferase domain-containing protein [Verrucomicrobiae bacterium]